jgi:hypothetical protein
MKLPVVILMVVVSTLLLAACGGDDHPSNLNDEMKDAAEALDKYKDVVVAIADGYLPTEDCVQAPPGVMGLHYVNPGLIGDPALDVNKPEVLLYNPGDDGVELVAVEYMLALGPPGADIPAEVPPAPELFGEHFHGPEAAPAPVVPPHYALHVWLYLETRLV